MKKARKLLVAVLILALTLSLAACGGEKNYGARWNKGLLRELPEYAFGGELNGEMIQTNYNVVCDVYYTGVLPEDYRSYITLFFETESLQTRESDHPYMILFENEQISGFVEFNIATTALRISAYDKAAAENAAGE